MKCRKNNHIASVLPVLILFIILFSSTSSAATAQNSSPVINITQISYSGIATHPTIYKDKIVWEEDYSNGYASDIYVYNLSTSKVEYSFSASGSPPCPVIYGNTIAWTDIRNGHREGNGYISSRDIYMYDLSTRIETLITEPPRNAGSPEIYGNRIVWEDGKDTVNIYMYNISTHNLHNITQLGTGRSSINPAIYGDRVVYQDGRNGYPQIYMYNVSSGNETLITDGKDDRTIEGVEPAIYGDKIVWLNPNVNYGDIYMYDISTSKVTQITTSGSADNLAIYGNRIVWEDYRNVSPDIYMYDLSTSQETQITNSGIAHNPAIYDNRIVWTYGRYRESNIYMATLSGEQKTPVANFSSNVTSGYAPLTVKFTDLSKKATSWSWKFGDGTSSKQQNPVHTFSTAGVYIVNLTVSNANGTGSKLSTINVEPELKTPVANFSSNVTSGYAPLSVKFTDLSKKATSWNWSFGDGTSSKQQNPVHIFSAAGNYIVNLTVSNANGKGSKSSMINVVQKNFITDQYAYITNWGSDTVSVINTATNKVTTTVTLGEGSLPLGVAVSPDGKKVYVTEINTKTVSVIDTATNNVTATVSVGKYPYGVAVSTNGKKVYVTNEGGATVSVIDTSTNNVVATVPVGSNPFGVAVSPDGTKIYVANQADNTISVIDTATNKVTDTVYLGNGYSPFGVAVSPDGTKVYVANQAANTISVINAATNKVIATVPVGYYAVGVAVSPDGTRVYVTNKGADSVSIIDTTTNTVTDTIPVGDSPFGVAVSLDGTKVYVTNKGADSVSIIDTATNKVTSTISVGNSPFAFGQFIGYVPTKQVVPVANFTSNVTSGKVPLTVAFTDKSTGTPTAWKWTFGDGTNSTVKNSKHKYSKAGNYTVSLTVSNAAGNNTKTKTNYIKVTAATPKPIANFTSNVTSGKVPLTVAFTDKSTETPTAWKWTFGDGTNSTVKNSKHKYSKVGNYTVSLTVSNAAGNNTKTKTNYIKVTAVTKPVAAFVGSQTSGNAPLNVNFTDKSTGTPTAWKWTFGDGTNSTTKNPVHKYSKAGNYTVALTATNAAGSNTTTKKNYIKAK